MTKTQTPSGRRVTPGGLLYWGGGLAVVGVMLASAGYGVGVPVAVAAAVALLIGAVAKGVELGRR